jgi:hypothetical protein
MFYIIFTVLIMVGVVLLLLPIFSLPTVRVDRDPSIYDENITIATMLYNGDVGRLVKMIDNITEPFVRKKVYIYAKDSTNERSLDQIRLLEETRPDLVFVDPIKLSERISKDVSNRTVRIGKIRNYLRSVISQHGDDDDLVIIIDGDLEVDGAGVHSALQKARDGEADVVCAYGYKSGFGGTRVMYDSFAYRPMGQLNMTYSKAHFLKIYLAELKLFYGSNDMEVDSAFNGAAIYHKKDLRDFQYSELPGVCEHVGLHRELRGEGRKIIIHRGFHVSCQKDQQKILNHEIPSHITR